MTAVEVLSMTQPPYARLSTGRLPCIPCRRPWGIVAERLHALACRALGRPPAHRAHRPQTEGTVKPLPRMTTTTMSSSA